jgi:membrane-bound lytic murein transglycosylase D
MKGRRTSKPQRGWGGTRRRRWALGAILACAACAPAARSLGRPSPLAAPAAQPASASDAPAAQRASRRDTVPAKPRIESVVPDVTPADVVRQAAGVFGDSVLPEPMTAANAPPEGPVWDIDVRSYETHDRVEHFVKLFSTTARGWFEKSLQRQTRYGALIAQRLREGGLPEDMTYLALIESWYDPHAYSSAAAVGMWQFMAGTARGVGLRVDWWVDERRDPVRSTEGAVRYLRSLRGQFGSMYLAAAAYNGGDGRVSRGLRRYADDMDGVEGEDRFFALSDTKYLRPQTRDYVPKLIAAALVGKEPARYGITVDSLPPLAFDSVEAPERTPLSAIANATGTSVLELKDLNPHILRGMTPDGAPMWVRVPPGSAGDFGDRLAALEPAERAAGKRVESKKGESMSTIARRNGLTVKQLAWYNRKVARLKSGNLRPGQAIFVPAHGTVAAALDVPDPSIERHPRRARAAKGKKGAVATKARAAATTKARAAATTKANAAARTKAKVPPVTKPRIVAARKQPAP